MLDFMVTRILFYRHLYRQKTSAFAGAGDALGLRGDYSSLSIINYHYDPVSRKIWIVKRYRSTTTTTTSKQSVASI
jgi:hypothetical protein